MLQTVDVGERHLSAYRSAVPEPINAGLLEEQYDVVVVHDAQPAGILLHGKGGARWIWRCHFDTSTPNAEVWQFLSRWLPGYDAAIFTMHEFQ